MITLRVTDDDVARIIVQQLLEVGATFHYKFDEAMNVITADRSQRYMDELQSSAVKLDDATRGV